MTMTLTTTRSSLLVLTAALLTISCKGSPGVVGSSSFGGASNGHGATGGASSGSTGTTGASGSTGGQTGSGSAGATGDMPKFDVEGGADVPGGGQVCTVLGDDGDPPGVCKDEAPPDSFVPDVQWAWDGEGAESESIVLPLVANMTDDNGDDAVDLCDVPDVVVVAYADGGSDPLPWPGHVYLLSGDDGSVHWKSDVEVSGLTSPALADLDDDGIPEVVAATPAGNLVAIDDDGSLMWTSQATIAAYWSAIAIADLDNDGTPEIMHGEAVFSHVGAVEVTLTGPIEWFVWVAPVAADLDGDGDLEVLVFGDTAYHHDGSVLWSVDDQPGIPQVADFDGDGDPEVLSTTAKGLSMYDGGNIVYQGLLPTGDPPTVANVWKRPAAVHDFDGDGDPEYAMSSAGHYSVYEADGSIVWSVPVKDSSGIASGTAFDFLGDGTAEAIYGDEESLFVFNANDGTQVLQVPRSSETILEYPVVADVDNDGSAEILVNSNRAGGMKTAPTLQVIRDAEDRWVGARRIWNQNTYHVTNIREDGRVPLFEAPHWKALNTFRTQAQLEGGKVCEPAG